MSNFDTAFQSVLLNEGGLETNVLDSGGTTKYGVSDVFLRSIQYPKSAKDLTLDDAHEIYLKHFWPQMHGDEIVDQTLANKILDFLVNLPGSAAARLVQRALGIPQDGVFGSETLRLLNTANPDTILLEIKARLCEYYARTVIKNPTDAVFLLGWMRRAVKP